MTKPLYFRNRKYGSGEYALRDKIEYEISYSHWHQGERTEQPYHVRRSDKANGDFINTEPVRAFATSDEAKQFCQDMCEGKVDLESLRMEIQKYHDDKKQKEDELARAGADKVNNLLSAKGITLADFLEVTRLWQDTADVSRRLLYNETENVAKGA